jgi:hypothetical protein
MEILLGLGLATLLVIGWFRASVLAAIFLTMGELLGMGVFSYEIFNAEADRLTGFVLVSGAIFSVIWAPIALQRYRRR